ncbi:MAG: 23S rRNA (pseudouridine(1915)-N(3))-methyltransferase RlmH [Clostridiales bacterium]|nr:23S rRNA (pseudouridine(1915)-N(3))-methyltransferase RlmH [Clostridiales bacterium]
MDIRIIAVGKIKEKYLRQNIEKTLLNLRRFCPVEIMEVTDERTPERLSLAQTNMVKVKEGQRINNLIRPNSFIIALAIEGKALSTENFRKSIRDAVEEGKENVDFIIGGSLGLDAGILKMADLSLSFSRLTFPHQLMRLILLDQIRHIIE